MELIIAVPLVLLSARLWTALNTLSALGIAAAPAIGGYLEPLVWLAAGCSTAAPGAGRASPTVEG